MECDVVRDLIPLYLDGCAAGGSVKLVREHTARCPGCRACLERSGAPLPEIVVDPPKTERISAWRASMLQSALFFVYFGILTIGVAREAATPLGADNGFWAFAVVAPAAGMLLGMAGWYFLRLYPNRRSFVAGAAACTAVCLTICFGWALRHYGWSLSKIPAAGLVFAAGNLILSAVLAGRFAAMTGKE